MPSHLRLLPPVDPPGLAVPGEVVTVAGLIGVVTGVAPDGTATVEVACAPGTVRPVDVLGQVWL